MEKKYIVLIVWSFVLFNWVIEDFINQKSYLLILNLNVHINNQRAFVKSDLSD
jgi:hypothetical protein